MAAIKPEMLEMSATKHAPTASAASLSFCQFTSLGYKFVLMNINFGLHKVMNLSASLMSIKFVVWLILKETNSNHKFGKPRVDSLMKRSPTLKSNSIIRSPKRRRENKTIRFTSSPKLAEMFANLQSNRALARSMAS